MQFTDTHCHLTLPQFDIDRPEVIHQAINKGLTKLLIPGISINNSEDGLWLCAKYPEHLFAAVGIHPNDLEVLFSKALMHLHSLIKQNNVVAIGEIGLDYYRNIFPVDLQKKYFTAQLRFAAEFDLPVCIHCRNSMDDILNILRKWKIQNNQHRSKRDFKGVFHSFFGTLNNAREIINLGFMLGISGPITYPKNLSLANTIHSIGIEHLLVETDAPFLSPQAVRGKRNRPENVVHVIEKLSEIFNLSSEKVSEITSANASRLFNW